MFELDNEKYMRVTKIGDSKLTDKLSEGQMISHNSPYHKNQVTKLSKRVLRNLDAYSK